MIVYSRHPMGSMLDIFGGDSAPPPETTFADVAKTGFSTLGTLITTAGFIYLLYTLSKHSKDIKAVIGGAKDAYEKHRST